MELIEFASALGYTIVVGRQGQEQPAQPRRRARRLSRGSDAPQHEPAHAGRVRRRLQDHGRDGGHRQRHRPGARRARACTARRPTATRWSKVLIPREDGGILSKKGVVDYTIGKGVAPGVFVIVEADASAHHRAHGRSAYRQGPLLQLLPALSPDLAGSAADRRAHHALRQARHGAAAESRSPRSARSPSAISRPARPSMRSARPATAPGP